MTATLETLHAQLSDVVSRLVRLEAEHSQQIAQLNAIQLGVQIMTQVVDNTQTAIANLIAEDDALLAAFATAQAGFSSLKDQLAQAEVQITDLKQQLAAGNPSDADVAKLQATLSAAQAETDKIAAVLPPVTPPTP